MPEVALANENVSNKATGVHVEDAAAGLAAGIIEAQQRLAIVAVLLAVVPGLRRVDFRMMPPRPLEFRLDRLHFLRGINEKRALARVANHRLLAGANFVVSLRAQHDLASHALVIAHFRDAAAPEFCYPLILPQQIF